MLATVWGQNGAVLSPWVEVYDAFGRKLATEALTADGGTTTVQASGLLPGQGEGTPVGAAGIGPDEVDASRQTVVERALGEAGADRSDAQERDLLRHHGGQARGSTIAGSRSATETAMRHEQRRAEPNG